MSSSQRDGSSQARRQEEEWRKQFDHDGYEWSKRASGNLRKCWGHSSFRENQRVIINATMEG